MVSQMGPRKNFDNAVKWWVEEFIDQEVGLVLKTSLKNNSIMDREHVEKNLKSIIKEFFYDIYRLVNFFWRNKENYRTV